MRGHPLKKAEFDKIKELVKAGVSYTMIGDLLKCNPSTISRASRFSTIEEYLESRRTVYERSKQKIDAENCKNIPDDSQIVTLLIVQNKKLFEITDYLRDCARLLNQISEQWK